MATPLTIASDIGPDETPRGAYLRRTHFPLQKRISDVNGDKQIPWIFIGLCAVGIISFCVACFILFIMPIMGW